MEVEVDADTGFEMTITTLWMKLNIFRARRAHVASCPLNLLKAVVNVHISKFMPFNHLCSLLKGTLVRRCE